MLKSSEETQFDGSLHRLGMHIVIKYENSKDIKGQLAEYDLPY
jgi:hypothetical protein